MGIAWEESRLFIDGLDADALAGEFGTPLYVYSLDRVRSALAELRGAFRRPPRICYPVKANGLLALLSHLGREGCGFDVVSGGELRRLEQAGLAGAEVVFAGVGKEEWEVAEALQGHRLLFFNVESLAELDLLEAVAARLGRTAAVALRLNPGIAAGGHSYLATGRRESKFGLAPREALQAAALLGRSRWLRLEGYHVHLGSLLAGPAPYLEAARLVQEFAAAAPGAGGVRYYDAGGGFAVPLAPGQPRFPFAALAPALEEILAGSGWELILEPGRFLVGEAGVLLTRVIRIKESGDHRFLIVDAAMNDLIRPALYGAEHLVWPVLGPPPPPDHLPAGSTDVVGPVCESGDFLGRDRELPPVSAGDVLALFGAGAYGAAMASRYNSRRLPAEVIVQEGRAILARARDAFGDLWQGERTG